MLVLVVLRELKSVSLKDDNRGAVCLFQLMPMHKATTVNLISSKPRA